MNQEIAVRGKRLNEIRLPPKPWFDLPEKVQATAASWDSSEESAEPSEDAPGEGSPGSPWRSSDGIEGRRVQRSSTPRERVSSRPTTRMATS